MQWSWGWLLLGAVGFVATSILGLVAVSALLVRLPADYFAESNQREFWLTAHPALRWIGLALKNVAGALLVALGVVLSLPGVPGPGILTILLGVILMDFPGKRKLERWFIGRPKVLDAVNQLRARHGKAPLTL